MNEENKDNINIEDNILIDYFLPQKDSIKNVILSDMKKSIKLYIDNYDIYIRFKYERIIIFKVNEKSIESIDILNYNEMIEDDLLYKLVNNSDKLDVRLRNLANNQSIDILKQEIIQALNLNMIKMKYNKRIEKIIGEWEYLNVFFIIDKNFKFVDVFVC